MWRWLACSVAAAAALQAAPAGGLRPAASAVAGAAGAGAAPARKTLDAPGREARRRRRCNGTRHGAGPAFGPEEYQAFIDYHPVSRFNHLEGVQRITDEGGRHRMCASLAQRLPSLIDRFDWALMGGEAFQHRRAADPQTVWVCSSCAESILRQAERKLDAGRSDRILIFNGDAWLSESFGATVPPSPYVSNDSLSFGPEAVAGYARRREAMRPEIEAYAARLRKYFGRIFFEAKDMVVPGIETMPIGFTEFFLRNGVAESAEAAIANASLTSKPGNVKGAFSFYHDLARCSRGWGEGQVLRRAARDWSKSAAAAAAGVDFRQVEPLEWWSTLARYKFVMAPNGCGVQTPKQTEALWVLTVPIARRGPYPAYDDLARYGFPIVVVDEWDEITVASTQEWWRKLSPRLVSFRQNCLTTEGYWRLLTGAALHCE